MAAKAPLAAAFEEAFERERKQEIKQQQKKLEGLTIACFVVAVAILVLGVCVVDSTYREFDPLPRDNVVQELRKQNSAMSDQLSQSIQREMSLRLEITTLQRECVQFKTDAETYKALLNMDFRPHPLPPGPDGERSILVPEKAPEGKLYDGSAI